jgi:hypothetical protein
MYWRAAASGAVDIENVAARIAFPNRRANGSGEGVLLNRWRLERAYLNVDGIS